MASYNGTVILSGMISPTDTTDTYPTHEDILGKGGYSTVVDLTARDAISNLRRKVGMMVYVSSNGKTYQLQGGTDNSNWTEFTSGANTEELVVTSIPLNGVINTIFAGITIPIGEILYVRGNNGKINTTVYNGIKTTVLTENKYNDFIIIYDGTNSSVYVNNTVDELHVQSAIAEYPIDYDVVDLVANTVSAKIVSILTSTYTDSLQIYTYEGVLSTIEKEDNVFEALNKNKEFVLIYDGTTFTAYKKSKVTIADLQDKKILS